MRFEKSARYEDFQWTQRKKSMALSRPEREAAKLRKALPLFAEQIQAQGVVDLDAEGSLRRASQQRFDQEQRDRTAKLWRKVRRSFFSATSEQQAAIRVEWAGWRGPLTPFMFGYIVDKHTGALEARTQAMWAKEAAVRADVNRGLCAQARLDLA